MDKSLIGSEKYAINTRALLIDLENLEHNIKKMSDFVKDEGGEFEAACQDAQDTYIST